ncbi:hypothetical protein [Yersinia aldovae]|uniref:hypothetical protein n=1 Tax=Yersinia aldovae TaxID=29483 RepID=UPI0011A8AAAE|nr:hypothetical protein [Yersinia aldovae]
MSEIKVYGLDSSLIHDADPKDGFVVDVVRFSDYVELEKKYQELAGENVVLTDKAASELSNSWLLHRAVMTIQASLHCIHGTNIDEAQCWLESIADDAELVIPPEMMLSDLQRWFDENMTGLIAHAKAVEIIKAEMSATTQELNEIKAQAIESALDAQIGKQAVTDELAGNVYLCAADLRQFAASLRGEQNV